VQLLPPARWLRLKDRGRQPGDFLARHVSGDWGDIPSEDINVIASYLAAATCFLNQVRCASLP